MGFKEVGPSEFYGKRSVPQVEGTQIKENPSNSGHFALQIADSTSIHSAGHMNPETSIDCDEKNAGRTERLQLTDLPIKILQSLPLHPKEWAMMSALNPSLRRYFHSFPAYRTAIDTLRNE